MFRITLLILGISLVFFAGISKTFENLNAQIKASYVGDSSCLEKCHEVQVTSFKKNKHMKAYIIIKDSKSFLNKKEQGKEGDCLKCHTTGYGKPGGFVDEETTPEQASVSCEACHGPGSEHIAVDLKNVSKKKDTIILKPDCGKCHLIH